MRRTLVLVAAIVVSAAADLELVLLHINDVHSRFEETDVNSSDHCSASDAARGECYGGVARIAGTVNAERRLAAEKGLPSLFVVAGDVFQGTPYYTFFKWRICAEVINELKPDIMNLGNHEFDDNIETVVSYLNNIGDVPTVVSNLNTTAHPDLNRRLSPSYVMTINGTKVGFVGYLTTDCPTVANTEDVEFINEIEPLKKEIKKLRDGGVNIIIAIGHSGINIDKIVIKEVEGIDLVVSSHSHTFLYSDPPPSTEIPYGPYPFYETNIKTNKSVPIVQAYAFTKYVGKIHLKFDSNGDLISSEGSPILMDHKIKPDPSMSRLVNKYKPLLTEITNVTVGRTIVELSNNCSLEECNFGNLIADSYVYYNKLMKTMNTKHWTDSPIGIIQSGGIRITIKHNDEYNGYISLGQLALAIPFLKKLYRVTIAGSTLLEVFEESVANYGDEENECRFLQVSGVKIEYDLSQNPGNRVSSLYLRCSNCVIPKYEPLVLTANYTIILNGFLARGGDNFKSFRKIVKKNEYLDVFDYNATAIYMKAISPIKVGIEGRIKFKNNKMNNNNNEKSKASNTVNARKSTLLLLSVVIFSTFLFL